MPVGVFVLSSASSSALRLSITGLILLLTLAVALNLSARIRPPRAVGPPLAFVGAGIVSALAIGGPLVVLYLLARGWTGGQLRASMALFHLVLMTAAAVGYVVAGLFTGERVTLLLISVVPLLLGLRISMMLVRRLNETMFRRGVLAVIAVTSVMVLARELFSILG